VDVGKHLAPGIAGYTRPKKRKPNEVKVRLREGKTTRRAPKGASRKEVKRVAVHRDSHDGQGI
jgi:ribosomal protein L6P/L9E